MVIIEAKDIVKKYKNKTVLDHLSFKIESGEVYGVLGKNGAGKSTLIKTILGLATHSSGSIEVFGKKAATGNSRIGYISENITLYPHLNAFEHIKISGLMADKKMKNSEISQILSKVGLSSSGNKPSKTFSLGMKRRLQLAIAVMVKKVDFLILDEPTNGLDVNGMIWFKEMIKECQNQNITILMATHSIKEMEEMITKFIIIDKGIITKKGDWGKQESKVIEANIHLSPQTVESCITVLKREHVTISEQSSHMIKVQTELTYKELSQLLYKSDIFPENLEIIGYSLEDMFKKYTEGTGIK